MQYLLPKPPKILFVFLGICHLPLEISCHLEEFSVIVKAKNI